MARQHTGGRSLFGIWNRSEVKRVVEETKNHYIAGDSGYPISDNLMKQYPTNESGRWKKSFLIVKKLESSQKIIVVTAILYNISRLRGEEDNKDAESDDSSDESECDASFARNG